MMMPFFFLKNQEDCKCIKKKHKSAVTNRPKKEKKKKEGGLGDSKGEKERPTSNKLELVMSNEI